MLSQKYCLNNRFKNIADIFFKPDAKSYLCSLIIDIVMDYLNFTPKMYQNFINYFIHLY